MFSAAHVGADPAPSIGHGADAAELLTFLVKPLGGWTRRLKEQVAARAAGAADSSRPIPRPLSLEAGLEGPYGYESSFYLR
jgi:hypothetical protein